MKNSGSMAKILVYSAVVLMLPGDLCFASGSFKPPLDPAEYLSENKSFVLKVDPSFPDGRNGGIHTFYKNGKILWRKTQDFTLRHGTKITNNGDIIGYSYSQGPLSLKNNKMFLWILRSNGEIVHSVEILRDKPMAIGDNRNNPYCKGVILHENFDKAIFRVDNTFEDIDSEKWYVVSISEAGEKSITYPSKEMDGRFRLGEVHAFPDHPLFLLVYELRGTYPSGYSEDVVCGKLVGSVFVVMDYDGNTVWIERNPDGLDFQKIGCKQKYVNEYVEDNGIAGLGHNSGEFWIAGLKEDEKLFCSIDRKNEIKISNRVKLNWLETVKSKNDNKTIKYHGGCKFLYSLKIIRDKDGAGPTNIRLFDFDEKNNAGCVSVDFVTCAYSFFLIDPNNEITACGKLDNKDWKERHPSCLKYWKNGKWLLMIPDNHDKNSLLYVLSSDGSFVSKIKTDAPRGENFVVDGKDHISVLSPHSIRQFDHAGKILRTLDKRFPVPGALSFAADMDITRDNELVVLDNIGDKIEYFSLNGKHLRTIRFDETKSGDLDYPTHVSAGPNGIVYVKESAGHHGIHEYNKKGKWLGSKTLKMKNGKPISYVGDMETDRNGRLWISDKALLAVDENGNETKRLGFLPEAGQIHTVSALDTDSSGMLYLFDKNTYTVFKLSQNGEIKSKFGLPKSSVPKSHFPGRPMLVDLDGGVLIATGGLRGKTWRKQYAKFDGNGRLTGKATFKGDIALNIAKGGYWSETYKEIFLLNGKGEDMLEIKRGPDNKWFRQIAHVCSDCSGRLLCHEYNGKIHIFDPGGKPVNSFMLENKWKKPLSIAISGNYIYFCYLKFNLIRILDLSGNEVAVFPSPDSLPKKFSGPRLIHADEVTNKLYVCDAETIHAFELLR